MLRYLNMFVIIGIALISISLAGFATGGNFLIEPGQSVDKMASIVYLGAGVLMIVNGALSARTAPAPQPPADKKVRTESTENVTTSEPAETA